MKFKLFVSLIVCFFSYSVVCNALEVKQIGHERKLVMSDSLKKKIADDFSDFRVPVKTDFVPFVYDMYDDGFPPNSAPFITFGDFNLDKVQDAVLMLIQKDKEKIIFVSILSSGKVAPRSGSKRPHHVKKFYSQEIDDGGNFKYLTTAKQEEMSYKTVTRGRSLTPRPAVRINVWGVGAPAGHFCFNNKKMTDCDPYLKRNDDGL